MFTELDLEGFEVVLGDTIDDDVLNDFTSMDYEAQCIDNLVNEFHEHAAVSREMQVETEETQETQEETTGAP